MTSTEDYQNYLFPRSGIRERYKTEVTQINGWGSSHVTVLRKVDNEAEDIWEEVTQYDRDYSMMKTFEPFQQKTDSGWHDYALISTEYVRLEVLDLESGQIIAVEEYPKVSKEMAEASSGRLTEGTSMPGVGFCPVEFHVPDWWDEYDARMMKASDNEKVDKEFLEEFSFYEGNWGVYSGCIWGDDSSWKIRYVDLSRISEGIVTTDERFGYVELPEKLSLKEAVRVDAEAGCVELTVPVKFKLDTGKAQYKKWVVDAINWEDAE